MSENTAIAAAVISVSMLFAGSPRAEDGALQGSGYYKNLLVRSETWSGEPFTLDLNRLRLAVKGPLAPAVSVDLQYDNEVLLGNYLRTTQFQQQKDIPPPQYWRADANIVETSRLYWVHRLYRAALTFSAGATDVRVGRQRVAWGTGRFWSPLDLLNPVSPTALERDERLGVDALLVEHKAGPLSRLSAVAAPGRGSVDSSAAMQWHDNVGGVDYSVVGGRLQGWQSAGVDLAGQIGQAGVRGELARQRRTGVSSFTRWLVGIDYAFGNTLTLTGELFFNGAGAQDPSAYDFQALMAGRAQLLGRHYLGIHAGYEITPLLKWEADLVVNASDRSRYIATSLAWSLRDNLDVKAGVQRFSGAEGTEYARPPDAVYVQLQRFF